MLQNFPSMNYKQPTSTSTVQISAEPANKFLNPSGKIVTDIYEALYTAVQSLTVVQRKQSRPVIVLTNFPLCFRVGGTHTLLAVVLYKAE